MSRFLPVVRSVVPAVAGAMRIPFWEVAIIFTVASTIWYGGISWIAFRVGKDWETVRGAVGGFAKALPGGSPRSAIWSSFSVDAPYQKVSATRSPAVRRPAMGATLRRADPRPAS